MTILSNVPAQNMIQEFLKVICIQIVFVTVLPITAWAAPAITCHCFKDRSYDPARPALADSYFLAMSQNTFFARAFNTDKMSIVLKKQQGTSSDDLWIAYWAGAATGTTPENLLRAKARSDSWQQVLTSIKFNPAHIGNKFMRALNSNPQPDKLAEAVVDETFERHGVLNSTELSRIRQSGVTNQELILSALISAKLNQPVLSIISEVRKGAKTWGTYLQSAKIDTKHMEQEMSLILKQKN